MTEPTFTTAYERALAAMAAEAVLIATSDVAQLRRPARYLDAESVADRLAVSESYVYKLAKAGVLPSHRINGGAVRFLEDELDTWMRNQPSARKDAA
ncbi:MAG: helix-turn-helix transcriptional regulator [Solirubrobacteraceae bacterium]